MISCCGVALAHTTISARPSRASNAETGMRVVALAGMCVGALAATIFVGWTSAARRGWWKVGVRSAIALARLLAPLHMRVRRRTLFCILFQWERLVARAEPMAAIQSSAIVSHSSLPLADRRMSIFGRSLGPSCVRSRYLGVVLAGVVIPDCERGSLDLRIPFEPAICQEALRRCSTCLLVPQPLIA